MKHINIPIFIPHMGCPNQCIFCNQRYISGSEKFDVEKVSYEIDQFILHSKDDDIREIAFFGGSFTGIDRKLMINLLDIAQSYVNSGKVKGIRMSTRPDYISDEIVSILKKYTISYVELGIQSMNDEVLSYLKRGHTVENIENAIMLLNNSGFSVVAQMMIGLPTATVDDEIYCAQKVCELGVSGARIYPTLVFKDTELEKISEKGEYTPLTIAEAVLRSAKALKVFNEHNVPCIRIGLCDSDNLHSNETFVAGPNSPSIGEQVKSYLFYELLEKDFSNNNCKNVIIACSKGKKSQVVGHRKENILKLKEKFHIDSVKIIEDSTLNEFEIKIYDKEEAKCV